MSERECRKGRGATRNVDNRYAETRVRQEDDGWGSLDAPLLPLVTKVQPENARTIISYNASPDLPIDRTINPYRGCEHGCIYCYARPSHAYFDLSPGLDFESCLFYKPYAAKLLRHELARPSYRPAPLGLGVNTDAYQPIERRLRVTREVLEVLAECRHPTSIITKSSLVERDLDLLEAMARDGTVDVGISITTLNRDVALRMEPRASSPQKRLETVARLTAAGVPVMVLVAPIVPVLTDHEMEGILERAREAGAADAGYATLRLPFEVNELFESWLCEHFPHKADHVLARVRDLHGGQLYNSAFGQRMKGRGIFGQLLQKRFHLAYKRLNFPSVAPLNTEHFRPPRSEKQLDLF